MADFRDFLKEGTIPECKALIRNFVVGIEVNGDEAVLTYTIPMPNDGVTSESASVLDFVNLAHLPRLEPARETVQRLLAGLVRCTVGDASVSARCLQVDGPRIPQFLVSIE